MELEQQRGKQRLETFIGALPEHLLKDLEPCRVIVHDEDAQPVGEDGGVGQGHGAATAAKPHSRASSGCLLSQGWEWGVGEQEGRGGWGSFKKRLKRTEGGGGRGRPMNIGAVG
jgi:hypothetical protein